MCPSVRLDQVGRKQHPDGRDDEDDELGRLEKSLRLGDAMDVRVVGALYGTGYATGYGTGSIGGGHLVCSLLVRSSMSIDESDAATPTEAAANYFDRSRDPAVLSKMRLTRGRRYNNSRSRRPLSA